MKKMRYGFSVAAMLLLAASLAIAGKAPRGARQDAAAATAVAIKDFKFVPQNITVKAGTTVTWTNQDEEPHKIAGDADKLLSRALDTDEHYSYVFNTPGTYKYFCTLHPKMVGTVVVQ